MIARRPIRIILAAVALGVVGVLTLFQVVAPTIASLIECGPLCSLALDSPSVLRYATPVVAIVLTAGFLLWPAILARPAAVGSGVLAIGWIGPVAQNSPPTVVMVVALSLLGATPFLLVTPAGPGAIRWSRRAWIGTIVIVLLLWVLDMSFSGFMQTTPVPPQLGFLGVATAIVAAGLGAGYLDRLDAARAHTFPQGVHTAPTGGAEKVDEIR